MPINLFYAEGNNVTITSTETSIAVNGGSTSPQSITDSGVYKIVVNGVTNMTKGDEYKIRIYEKASSTDGQLIAFQCSLLGRQSELWIMPSIELGIGWNATMQLISANPRGISWSIRRVS